MIAFVTLFLGLVTGSQIVEVAVSERVAVVELQLDGELMGRIRGEPWRAEIDFGGDLTTHELVAVARDATGAEVARASQQINVPRSPVEAEILLEGWRQGRPRWARLIWRSSQLLEPQAIAVSLDGVALPVADPDRIELPAVEPRSLHFISAELTFPGNLRSSVQSIFGGRYGVEVETELTAVPVSPKGRRLKEPGDAEGWLQRRGGGPLRVVALEDEVAELLIVRDEAALPPLQRLARKLQGDRLGSVERLGLEADDRVFLMSARAVIAAHPEVDYELFPISRAFGLERTSLPEALAVFRLTEPTTTEQRLADAVAVAGVMAAAGGRRRSVLLVVADCAERSGHWSGEAVRRYLDELRVPLEVWATRRPDPDSGGFCEGALRISSTGSYVLALSRLGRRLERQQVLWVEGRHLPRQIVLAETARATEITNEN